MGQSDGDSWKRRVAERSQGRVNVKEERVWRWGNCGKNRDQTPKDERSEPMKSSAFVTGKAGGACLMVVFAGLLLFCAGSLAAQDKPSDNMQIVLEKVRADKKLLVAQNMDLTEAQGKAFWPVYDRYQDELFLLRVRSAKLMKDYADAYETITDGMARKLLDEYMTIETLRLKLGKAYLPKFSNVLPGAKVARYYQIENKINAVLYYELAGGIPLVKGDKK